LDFLELFAVQKRPLSLSDISRLLSIPVSSCHDVLQALQARGFIYEVSPRGGYYPTLRMFETGRVIAEHDPVVMRAEFVLRELRDTLDESVLLAKVSGLKGMYLLAFETSNPLRYQINVGQGIASLHAASAGKAILGGLDDDTLALALKDLHMPAFTAKTATDSLSLRRDVESGRARGYYLNLGESIEGVTTISAPFHWQKSMYIVTVVAPAARLEGRLAETGAMLLETCRKLEMRAVG
jgi:DNA-binding IclR family transcriptional regulator